MTAQNQVDRDRPTQRAAVIFDLFNTLTAPIDEAEFSSSLTEMAQALGADPGAFTQAWFRLWRERFAGVFPTGEACVQGVCESIGIQAAETATSRAAQIRIEFSRRTLQPRQDAVPTLTRLRSAGYKLALISDCSPEVPILWASTPFAPAIDEPLFSCVEGLVKPDPSIYLRACVRLGVELEACVYVGDGGNRELSGARQVGMRSILLKPPGEASAQYDSEASTWHGETIEALGEIPRLLAARASPNDSD